MYLNLALLAGFMLLYSIVAGRLERSPVSGALVFTVFGLVCGPYVLGVLGFEVGNTILQTLAEITLAIVLFIDASLADFSVLRKSYGILVRLLLVGLPLTLAAGFGFGVLFFENLSFVEIALLATMLAPTDAALGKPVVTNKSLPDEIRENLSFESGLNDGICVPILLFFLVAATQTTGAVVSGDLLVNLLVKEIGIGILVGVFIVTVAGFLLRGAEARGWVTERWSRIVVAAVAITCFATAQWLGGSGLISAFFGGLLFGVWSKRNKHDLLHAGEVFGETFSLVTWVFFGSAVVGYAVNGMTWTILVYSLLSLTVIRMVPVILSLTGSGIPMRGKFFIGWFGPRGSPVLFLPSWSQIIVFPVGKPYRLQLQQPCCSVSSRMA
jgi:NhaP-type Na+/H+ or K+/H+ antiporter